MARDTDALLVRKWGATSTLVETPEDAGLDRAVGFPASYGVDMARALVAVAAADARGDGRVRRTRGDRHPGVVG